MVVPMMVVPMMVVLMMVIPIMVVPIIATMTDTRTRGALGILRIGTPVIDYGGPIKIRDLPDLYIKPTRKTPMNPVMRMV
jgi:hypothetical protein